MTSNIPKADILISRSGVKFCRLLYSNFFFKWMMGEKIKLKTGSKKIHLINCEILQKN